MVLRRTLVQMLFYTAFGASSAGISLSQDRFWDTTAGAGNGVGGSGTWGTTFSSLSTGSATLTTASSSNNVFFEGTAGTVTLNADQTVASNRFNVTNYTIATSGSAGTRVLTGQIILANNVNLNISPINSVPLTVGSISGGTGSTLTIGGTNSLSTDVVRVNLASGASIGATAPITISTAGSSGLSGFVSANGTSTINATLANSSGVRTMLGATSGNTLNVSGVVSGTQGVRFSAGSSGGAGTININAAGTYTGTTEFNGTTSGVVRLGTTNGLSTTSAVVMGLSSGNGQAFDLNGFDQQIASLSSNAGGTGLIRNNGTGSGTNTLTISGSTTSSFGLVIGNGTTRLTALTLGSSNTGTQTLTAVNTYTGGTTISGGTLVLGHATNTLANTGAINVNGGTLALGANSDTVGAVSLTSGSITGSSGVLTGSSYAVESGSASAILGGSGALTKSTSGTVTLTAANTYTGGTTVQAGTLQLSGGSNRLSTTGAIAVSGGALDLGTHSQLTSGNVQLTGGAINNGTLSKTGGFFDVQSGSASAALTGSAGLAKSGTGTVTLSGANAYTGTTTINAGTLLVNGTHTGGGAYTVNAGGTLGGSGTVAANVNVVGGTLSAGNSIGTMTINGGLTFDPASKLIVEFNSSSLSGLTIGSDLLTVNGALQLNSANLVLSDLSLPLATAPLGSSFTFLTASSIVGNFAGLADGAVTNIGSNQWRISYGATSISFASVPEPSSLALIGLLGLGGLTYRRLRNKKSRLPEIVG